MKTLWKKIVALICVVSLCVGSIHVTTMAVDSYTGKLTIKGSLATSSNPVNFYIKGTDSYTIGEEWSDSTMMPASDDTASGIFVNGERIENYYSAGQNPTSVRLRKINDAGHYYIENIPDVVTGSVVTIKGTFYVYGGWLQTDVFDSTPIVIEESNFQWNGSQWIDCYAGKLAIKDSLATSSNSTNFYMKGTDSYTIGSEWSDSTMMPASDDATSGIFVDGIRIENYYSAGQNPTSVRMRKINDNGEHYYIENIPNVATGSIVTIKGTFYVYGGWLQTDVYDSTPIIIEKSNFQWNGSQWVDYVPETVYNGKLTIKGAALENNTSSTTFYIKGTDAYATNSGDNWPESTMVPKADDTESGIFVDGVRIETYFNGNNSSSVRLRKYNDANCYYYIQNIPNVKTGSVVTIKGTFYTYGNWMETDQFDSAAIQFEESYFQWNGSQWVDYVPETIYNGKLTIKGAELENNTSSTTFYIKGTDAYATNSGDNWPESTMVPNADDVESGIFVDGVRIETYFNGNNSSSVRLRKYNDANCYYYIQNIPNVKTGSVVTIKGTFYTYGNWMETDQFDSTAIVFEKSQFQWNGTKWVDYVEPTTYTSKLTSDAGQIISSSSTGIYLGGTDAWLSGNGEAWNVAYLTADSYDEDSGIWLGDNKITGVSLQKYWGASNYYYLTGFGTASIKDIITIKGTFYSADRLTAITFDETKIQFFGNRWLDCENIVTLQEGILWIDTNIQSTAANLYLRGSVDVHEDCAPTDNPDLGWKTGLGTVGFWKNGTACSGELKNVANDGGWYAGLEGAEFSDGDKLTIQGIFGYEGSYVFFEEQNFWYTNDGWKITPAITSDTKLYGDANGDNALNSLDLVRLIKYINKQPVTIYKEDANGNNTGADANGVDGVNDRDRLKIYEYILEGAKRTVDGSYTVEYYPVYLDDEDIKLGAYNGPRTSGYEDYSYTSGGTLTSRPVAESFLNSTEFERYKNAGLNTLLHEYDGAYSSKAAGIGYGVDDGNFRNYLAFAKEAGLNIYITSMGLSSYIKFEGAGNGPTSIDFNGDGNLSSTAVTIDETKYGWDYNGDGVVSASAQMPEIFYYSDNIKHRDLNSAVYPGQKMTILEADISELFEYIVDNGYQDIFKGIMMPDEPWLVAKDRYTSAINLINALAAEYGLDIDYQGCLYPSYAETDAIGNNYNTYVAAFGTARKSLMYDFYPLQIKKFIGTSNILDEEWLTNLQTVASLGKENNYTTGITIQSSGFETSQSSWIKNYRRDPKSDADIQFQVYSSLAFGMKKINYFTYWEKQFQGDEMFTSSMVEYPAAGGTEGEETAVYGYVKNANTEITKFDHVFMDYDWVNTKAVGSSDLFTTAMKNVELSNVKVSSDSTGNSIISHMYDSEKQLDGYWLVNMAEPSTSTKATLNVTFADKNKAMVYINGEETIVDLTNGVYSADLAVGEGIFIIPLNIQ